MENYDKTLRQIKEVGIFVRFPELRPFEGPNCDNDKNHSKLLLIGESNYFEDKWESTSDFKKPEKWYQDQEGEKSLLIPDEMKDKVNNGGKIEYLKGLSNIIKKLLNTDPYNEIAFYNYFLRPASDKITKGGKHDWGFNDDYTDLDGEVAYEAFCQVLEELHPDIVVFASSLAYEKMVFFKKKYNKNFGKITIEKVSHPSSPWWNRSNGAYGRQLFENLLIKHWIKKFQKLQTIHSELRQKFLVEKDQECFFDENGNYLSCLNFKVEDYSFCCETGVRINGFDFWTCFYKTENSKEILALKGKGYDFKQDFNNDKIIEKIEKQIREIIEEVSEK